MVLATESDKNRRIRRMRYIWSATGLSSRTSSFSTIYKKWINNNIQSPIRLFADDSIIYRKIKSETDNNILQSDLIQLQSWSTKWQMEFNIPKCMHLPITNKTKPRLHSYSLCGVPLSTVSSHPYLGIKLDTKLTWTNHITDITSKSSKVLGMIQRNPRSMQT